MKIRSGITGILAVVTLLYVTCAACWSQDAQLTILHTNDTHGHLLPFSYSSRHFVDPPTDTMLPANIDIGGIARRATLIKQVKAESKCPVLVMDAGDILDGTPFSVEYDGEADFAAMNACGYDVVVTGNHDYNMTPENFEKRKQQAKFAYINANMRDSQGKPVLLPYVIKNEGALRVAILGLTISADGRPDLQVDDPIIVAKRLVPELRKKADAVILLTHIGVDQDRLLAQQVSGIDVIVGGHTHTRLEKPILIKSADAPRPNWIGATVIVQAFQWGSELGELNLTFHKGDHGWTLAGYDGKLLPITSAIAEDPTAKAIIDKYYKAMFPKYSEVIFKTTADIGDEAAHNLTCDAMRDISKTDFAVDYTGDAFGGLRKGDVKLWDFVDYLAFRNAYYVTFKATGAQIKEILHKEHPSVSNLRYRIKDDKFASAEIGGKPIEDGRVYSGVTTSVFSVFGLPQGIDAMYSKTLVRDSLINYLKAKKIVTPDDEQRGQF